MSISPLGSILTSQIGATNSLGAGSETSRAKQTDNTGQDTVGISKIAQFFQKLEQLETSNPTEFKKELTDIAAKLKGAAQNESDPSQARFLSNLADRFQKAADTGDLSALKPGAADSGTGAPHAGHHHGHHGPPKLDQQTQDTLASIFQDAETTLNAQTSSTQGTTTQA
jgi:hypothetical protein